MKKILCSLLLLVIGTAEAQNQLLDSDFWKKNPNLASVRFAVAQGNDPTEPNRANFDPVCLAINNNAPLETILFLLDQKGNSVDKKTHDGRIYLHWAASKGNEELVRHLIQSGSNIHHIDDKGASPLSFAAGFGLNNTKIYDLFFKAGVNPKTKYQNGATLMHLVVGYDKDLKITDYLINKGLSLKDTDDLGNTVFHYASRTGNTEILKQLLKRKVTYDGRALIFASQGTRFASPQLDTYRFLVEDLKISPKSTGDNGENVLHNLVRKSKQKENILYFLSKDVDVNQTDKDGKNVLMFAGNLEPELFQNVLAAIKNINAKDLKGGSALSAAIHNGTAANVAILLKNGADVKIIDNKGNNVGYEWIQSYRPLSNGQKDEFSEKMELLKEAGFDFLQSQRDGNTLLHLAVAKNDLNLLKKLSVLGIDINAKNSEGFTALHKAALLAKDNTILLFLTTQGAQKDITTDFDETAYDLASENEYLSKNNISIDFLK